MLTLARNILTRRMKPRQGAVAVNFRQQGMALAQVHVNERETPKLHHCTLTPCHEGERARVLKHAIEQLDLVGSPCCLALDSADYRLLQVPKPDVPQAEVRDALRWRVQDMVDFAMDDAELEFFQMPTSRQGGRSEMLSVALCQRSLIRTYSEYCEKAGLILRVIDIPQLALRNLAEHLPESKRGVVLIHLDETRGLLQLQRDDTVYITRELDFGSRALASALAEEPIANEFVDRLALEIQRSLDYYESYYGMPPVAGLVLAPIPAYTQALVDRLNRSLGVIARAMDVTALFSCPGPLDDATQQRCLPAIGAAVRLEIPR